MPSRPGSASWRPATRLVASALVCVLLGGLLSLSEPVSPAQADEALTTCRVASSGATGDPYERYTSLDSRATDSVTGLQIVPVYAPRLYIDPRSGYDASYIAYRIHNGTGAPLTNLTIALDGFTTSDPVQLANPADARQTIAKLDRDAGDTVYFLVTASRAVEAVSHHAVRVFERTPSATTQLAACQASITAVQRSLAASANKVTKIEVKGSSVLGQTLSIEVTGAPGKVPSADPLNPYFSIMTLSPTGSTKWPTRALRLESSSIVVKGISNNIAVRNNCRDNGATTAGAGQTLTATWAETLVLQNFGSCATTTKQTYLATYVFRVVGVAASSPLIRPISDISSGQQIKYTGSFPAAESTVPLTPDDVSVPLTVTKAFVSSSRPVPGPVDIVYRLTATSTGGQVVLDEMVDTPDSRAVFVSAEYSDALYTNRGIVPAVGPNNQLRFLGPFEVDSVGSKTATITYTMRVPDKTATYRNTAYGVSGNFIVGSNATEVDVVTVTTDCDPPGECDGDGSTTKERKPGTPQTISFSPPASLGAGVSIELTGYSDSGLPLTYTVADSAICNVLEFDGVWTLVTLAPGGCMITASQAGGGGFDPATPVTKTVVVKPGQVLESTITQNFGSGTTAFVKVWSDSGLSPTLQSITQGVCTVGASTSASPPTGALSFTITKGTDTGNCYLLANQPGDDNFGPASELEILLGVGKSQTIRISSPAAGASFDMKTVTKFSIVGDAVETGTTTKLRHAITFQSTTPTVCAVTLDIVDDELSDGYVNSSQTTTVDVTLRGAGTCTIVASQDGTDYLGAATDYAPAENLSRSFSIVAPGTTEQVISLTTPHTSLIYGDAAFTVTADSKKTDGTLTNLLVSLSATDGVCRVGTPSLSAGVTTATLAIVSIGTCTITATQSGDSTYKAATTQTVTITITPKTITIAGWTVATKEYDDTDTASLNGTAVLSGVVEGDTNSDISLVGAGSATSTFASPLPDTNVVVTVVGPTLGGNKTANYVLAIPGDLRGEITQRRVTVTAQNQSVIAGEDATVPCEVVAGRLLSGHVIASPACSVGGSSASAEGDYVISITGATVRFASDATSDISNRYDFEFVSGTLTVLRAGLKPVTLEADDLDLVYGDSLHSELGELVTGSLTTNSQGKKIGVRAKANDLPDVPGELSQKVGASSVDPTRRYEAGSYTVTVTFTPTDTGKYGSASVTRQVVITPKSVTVALSAAPKEYDGTTNVVLGTPSLDGVLAGDTVSLSGTLVGNFVSSNAGESVAVNASGLSLGGTHANNYSLAALPSPTATITPRPLTPVIVPQDKTYDGSKTVSFNTPTLPQGGSTGVVTADAASVTIEGSLSGEFASSDAGDAVSVSSVSGINLAGTRSPNYSLRMPTGLTARIIPRPVSVRVNNASMLVRQPEPTFSAVVDAEFVGSDTEDSIVGPVTAAVKGTRDFSLPGTKTINAIIAGASGSPNYSITTVSGTLYIASIEVAVAEEDGTITSPEVECACEGLAPNTPITLSIFSVETRIVTSTTDANGECPLLKGSIPGTVGPGSHTLEVKGKFPDDSDAIYRLPVVVPVFQTNNPGPSSGGPGLNPPATASPSFALPGRVPPPGVSPVESQGPQAVTPAPATTPAGPGALLRFHAPGQPFAMVDGAQVMNPGLFFSGWASVDLGAPVPTGISLTAGKVSSAAAAHVSLRELSRETMTGFAPGVSTLIEILGTRTAARFVVSDTSQVDQFTLIRAIEASVPTQATDFFAIESVQPVSQPIVPRPWTSSERAGATEFFRGAGLPTPQTLADLPLENYSNWLLVSANASTYAPGTNVYLTITSEPLILASVVVGADGTANLAGTIPVEYLTAGEHRVRLVGIRALEGVSVDDEGAIQLSPELLGEIERFDLGTQATIAVFGQNLDGAPHLALRVIPLVPVAPWWTLWLILGGALISLAIRFTPRRAVGIRRVTSIVVGAVALLPAIILGWLSTVTAVAWWGLGLGLAAVALSAVGPYRHANAEKPASSQRG